MEETGFSRLLREKLSTLAEGQRESVEELRLREGYPLSAVTAGEEWTPPAWQKESVTQEQLSRVLEAAGQGSVHTVLDQLRGGYVTAPGGYRLGLCGQAAMEGGSMRSFRRVTSLSIRIPHKIPRLASPLLGELLENGHLVSTLIFSPPGLGKTTLLRDLIFCVSEGVGQSPLRVGVADERGELGGGDLRYGLGRRADVLENCPKALALSMLLRSMNPQVLAVDEITAPEDTKAVEEAAGCGVLLLATAHGGSLEEVRQRPVYQPLFQRRLFPKLIQISLSRGRRVYRVLRPEMAP